MGEAIDSTIKVKPKTKFIVKYGKYTISRYIGEIDQLELGHITMFEPIGAYDPDMLEIDLEDCTGINNCVLVDYETGTDHLYLARFSKVSGVERLKCEIDTAHKDALSLWLGDSTLLDEYHRMCGELGLFADNETDRSICNLENLVYIKPANTRSIDIELLDLDIQGAFTYIIDSIGVTNLNIRLTRDIKYLSPIAIYAYDDNDITIALSIDNLISTETILALTNWATWAYATHDIHTTVLFEEFLNHVKEWVKFDKDFGIKVKVDYGTRTETRSLHSGSTEAWIMNAGFRYLDGNPNEAKYKSALAWFIGKKYPGACWDLAKGDLKWVNSMR